VSAKSPQSTSRSFSFALGTALRPPELTFLIRFRCRKADIPGYLCSRLPQILDATATLVAAGGPGTATIGAIGALLKAPSGSIYHRFASRDVLLGRLWLSKAAFFQNRFVEALANPDAAKAGLDAALSLPRSVRADFAGARIMLLYRRDDFLAGDWPVEMAAEAARLKRQVDDAMRDIAGRLFGRTSVQALRLANFAILDVPFAAVRRHVAATEMPPRYVDELIAKAYAALIAPARASSPNGNGGHVQSSE
jgi:AcrR family transcriptional regulator